MKGLELSRKYYETACRPVLKGRLGEKFNRLAVGLVGNGSECYGFDDELSQDHDFGPRFFIWLTDEDDAAIGAEVRAAMEAVPKNFLDYKGVNVSEHGAVGRQGVFRIGTYYRMMLGIDHVPASIDEWRRLGEVNLSIATNGEVFEDGPGAFTAFRNALKAGFPEDLRRKKIAAVCCSAAQTGQYNYIRCLRRGEAVGAHICEAEFMEHAMRLVYLLNNAYRPFYKWIHRGLLDLPILGRETYDRLGELIKAGDPGEHVDRIEALCGKIIEELRRQGLTDSPSTFLLDHGAQVQARIQDPVLRKMAPFAEP